eukprot:TRINITY_DN62224_c0_g2_i1.p1 TRINITY_DN62224_c0_g2~~TRINITY_DN62224_c0_g2_i1.p1  ORF type:complete len:530 (+),score=53.37 TRINITY_DN62224_c0_g2_i1:42-1631(+)
MPSANLEICCNGNFKNSRAIVFDLASETHQPDKFWKTMMSTAKNKLKMKKVTRVFSITGYEYDTTNKQIPPDILANDAKIKLVFSAGEDFTGKVTATEQPKATGTGVSVRVLAKDSLVEGEAIKQLHQVGTLPGVKIVVGMPDLHPGRGFPIGAAVASEGQFYPHLVGNDVGCGMLLAETELKQKKANVDKMASKLHDLEFGFEGDTEPFLKQFGAKATECDKQLGSIGGGNHFAELQEVHEVIDRETFDSMKLSEEKLYLLVHSGSRGLGAQIFDSHMSKNGPTSLLDTSEDAKVYFEKHDNAVQWARANRFVIATRFCAQLSAPDFRPILDICHNSVLKKPWSLDTQPKDTPTSTTTTTSTQSASQPDEQDKSKDEQEPSSTADSTDIATATSEVGCCNYWLHRKGAAPADCGVVVIPGSRGHHSYLVKPVESAGEKCGYSVAHGAGRRWARGHALQHAEGKGHQKSQYTTTKLGSKVICEDKTIMFEEAPDAYKDIDEIVTDLVENGIVSVVAIFKPLVTYKTRSG